MDVVRLTCSSCGAPIQVPADLDAFHCAYCGTALTVKRGEGYVALQVAEKVVRVVEESGMQTQSVIREELEATRSQLRLLELKQQLGTVEAQLYTVQSEIRALDRQKRLTPRERREMRALREAEGRLTLRIAELHRALHPTPEDTVNQRAPRPSGGGCVAVVMLLMLFAACSVTGTFLALIGFHPLLAYVVAAILIAVIAAKIHGRRKEPRAAVPGSTAPSLRVPGA
jgi:hypothetical protein